MRRCRNCVGTGFMALGIGLLLGSLVGGFWLGLLGVVALVAGCSVTHRR